MGIKDRYQVADNIRVFSSYLKIDPIRLLRRAGLPDDYLQTETKGVTPKQMFALWDALFEEHQSSVQIAELAKTFSRGPFVPAIFAFSCSPNIELGISRLAVFKPLLAPLRLEVRRVDDNVKIILSAIDQVHELPDLFTKFELLYILECCRLFTGKHIIPVSMGRPNLNKSWSELRRFTGTDPVEDPDIHITFSLEDAHLPLINRNERMWEVFEQDLRRQLAERNKTIEMSERVRSALLEGLPAGLHTTSDICASLHVSRRTLQRRLKEEGTSFQEILDQTRNELSHHYLKQQHLSLPEISYLLGFNEPSSFFRVFKNWTGKTPMQVRQLLMT